MSFARSVLDGADLVVSATTTSEPFVKQEWISPGAFVYSIGIRSRVAIPEGVGGRRGDPAAVLRRTSVVSHKYGYEDARGFWLSARRDDL